MGRLMSRNNSATPQIEQERLVLDAPMGYHFVLPRENIAKITSAEVRFWRWSWILKRSIVLVHAAPNVPNALVFHAKSLETEQMLSQLEGYEYPIEHA
jgi:hypothetical protein